MSRLIRWSLALVVSGMTVSLLAPALASAATVRTPSKVSCSISSRSPRQYTTIKVRAVVTDRRGRAVKGAKVVFTFRYATTSRSATRVSDARGIAECRENIGGAGAGHRVLVTARATVGRRSATGSIAFTPVAAPRPGGGVTPGTEPWSEEPVPPPATWPSAWLSPPVDPALPASPAVEIMRAVRVPENASLTRWDSPALKRSVGMLGVDLLTKVRSSDAEQNCVVSPFSVYSALALAQGGARGKTLEEMRRVLHVENIDPALADQAYADYLAHPLDGPPNGFVTGGTPMQIRIANAMWVQPGFPFLPAFLDRNRDWYGSEIASLDFASPEAPAPVNRWVSDNTNGLIPKIVDKFDTGTVAALVNAVYVKGSWVKPFSSTYTEDKAFHLPGGRAVQVPTMTGGIEEVYRETDVYQATKRGLLGGDMAIYLPKAGKTPSDVLRVLSAERSAASAPVWESDRFGTLYLPRFKIAWSGSVKDVLVALGMHDAFDPASADFSGMADFSPLWLSQAIHSATTSVDEDGVEAAAATMVGAVAGGAIGSSKPPVEMRVDRPFVYELSAGGMPLFIGVVNDPR